MNIDLLRKIPFFSELGDEEVLALQSLLKPRSFKANETVFWIGESGTDFCIVQQGSVALTYPDETGKENTLAVLGPGDFFGELSLLDGGPRTATSRAVTDVQLLYLTREEFLDFIRAHPSSTIHMLQVLGRRQRGTLEQLRGIRNPNKLIEEITEHGPLWDRIADKIAALSASQTFLLVHIAWFLGWTLINGLSGNRAFDPFPFGLLTMVVSLEAIFLSIFVLVSANRQSEKDRIRAELDYQVNLKAHLEVMRLHQKIDQLQNEVNALNGQISVKTPSESVTSKANV
ncbi:MAG TPA: DUF1003 domain-containing protein [Thermodesulfobacteriota bacterium]|nr:DUF1003 domain-containing protein [Thermodesulfobacteriota bacterium]